MFKVEKKLLHDIVVLKFRNYLPLNRFSGNLIVQMHVLQTLVTGSF